MEPGPGGFSILDHSLLQQCSKLAKQICRSIYINHQESPMDTAALIKLPGDEARLGDAWPGRFR